MEGASRAEAQFYYPGRQTRVRYVVPPRTPVVLLLLEIAGARDNTNFKQNKNKVSQVQLFTCPRVIIGCYMSFYWKIFLLPNDYFIERFDIVISSLFSRLNAKRYKSKSPLNTYPFYSIFSQVYLLYHLRQREGTRVLW